MLPIMGRQSVRNFLRFLIPSFIADRLYPDQKPTYKLHPTSYLDGLRGIASVLVFICHYTECNWGDLTHFYGVNKENPGSFIQMPYIRLIYSGRPMVHIFFIISGFVLSYKPIKAIHARDMLKCYSALSSSTFRRAFRLFGPCIVSTFMIMILAQYDLVWPGPKETWTDQLITFKDSSFHGILWPWDWDRDVIPNYDIHLWTIPIEFAHSMLLFIVILGLSHVRLRLRQITVFGIMIWCLACGKWAAFEFLTGLFLAEIVLLKSARRPGWESPEKNFSSPNSVMKKLKTALHVLIMVVGLYIAGWPNHDADKTPGISWFYRKTPFPFCVIDVTYPQKYWFGLSAAFMVWTIGEMPVLKKLFESGFAQYCGRISYAIYIVHGAVIDLYDGYVVGFAYSPQVGEPGDYGYRPTVMPSGLKSYVGTATSSQQALGWFIGLLIIGPLTFWYADVFWRAVDDPIVKLGRKIEMACVDDVEELPKSNGYSAPA